MPLPDVVSGLLLSPRSPVRARAGVPGRQKEQTPFRFRLTAKTALCWLLLPFPNRTHSVGLRFGCLRSSAAASGVRLTDGVVFPFQIEPISLGFDLVSIKEQTPFRFRLAAKTALMLVPSSFSESNPLRWASIGFLFRAVGEKEILWNAIGNTPGNGSIRSGSRDMFNRLIWHRMR